MPETDDPRKALMSDDVATRAAGARALGEIGVFEDAAVLLSLAKGDKSPSVRLNAATSAAEIIERSDLGAEQRAQILAAFDGYDPVHNPSLPLVLAGVLDDNGVERLGRLMRDPRSDVRAGAATALKRMSKLPKSDPLLPDAVRRWLLAAKHPDDATAELVRLASESGFPAMDEALGRAAKRGRASAIAVREALDWLVSRRDPASWVGLWLSLDDGGEVIDWLWLEKGRVWGETGELGELTVGDGIGAVADRPPLHRIRLGRASEEGLTDGMRVGESVLWRYTGRALVKLIDTIDTRVLRCCVPASLGVAKEIASLEGTTAVRARAIALWRAGALAEALSVLESATAGEKRIKPEIQWLMGNLLRGLGETGRARAMLQSALQGAPKKAAWRGEAEIMLAEIESA